jgi:hypothetical protein
MNGVYIFFFSFIFVGFCGIWLWKRSYRPEQDSLLVGAWSAAAGTLFGFLVALSVYYIQAEQQHSAEESQAAATRARIITLLKTELSYDLHL